MAAKEQEDRGELPVLGGMANGRPGANRARTPDERKLREEQRHETMRAHLDAEQLRAVEEALKAQGEA